MAETNSPQQGEPQGEAPLTPEERIAIRQIIAAREDRRTEQRARMLLEGLKGLVLINGAGAAALATFLQAVWDKPDAAGLRIWLLQGIAWLAVGVALAAVSFFPRYIHGLSASHARPLRSLWWWIWVAIMLGSATCFVVGMLIVALKGYRFLAVS